MLRPDGILGLSAPLVAFRSVAVLYLERLLVPDYTGGLLVNSISDGVGHLHNENESSLNIGREEGRCCSVDQS